MSHVDQVPHWVLRPLPANTTSDANLLKEIEEVCAKLPNHFYHLHSLLQRVRCFREYDSAVNDACVRVWRLLPQLFAGTVGAKHSLLYFASQHMPPEAQARIYRRLAKDAVLSVRRKAQQLVQRAHLQEVALPREPEGAWDPTGWFKGVVNDRLDRHRQGRRIQEANGVPPLNNVGEMRQLLGIRSEAQLGYLLLATDNENGPYTTFTIPKRDGSQRAISAPKAQLRWVQRLLLDKILARVAPHEAAHGFVAGRSTVTNARPHRGAAVVLKFDLTDFFPTIHYYRVVGLFTSLGYHVGDATFRNSDDSRNVAPTLARLCCYTDDSRSWGTALLPQGAPTSPALSNLVCRRLDRRLTGLAQRNGGVYTRYADDLTFSFKEAPVALGRFRWWVDQICHQEGFLINQRKFRVIRASQRQVVTGLVVNDDLRVPREERRRFRAILHNCRQQGVASQSRGNPGFGDYLRGYASYLHMVHPEEGAGLLREVADLLGPDTEGEETS